MAEPKPELSVVIPAYREGARLAAGLEAVRAAAASWPFPHEVIASVHAGQDATRAAAAGVAAQWPACRVVDVPVPSGKGAAVRAGMLAAHGALVVFADADMSVPPSALGGLPGWFRARPGVAVGIGSRTHPASRLPQRRGWVRGLTARGFNRWVRLLTGLPFADTQCGFKAFRAEAVPVLFGPLECRGFAFDVELLLRARRAGFAVEEIPVEWRSGPETSVSVPRDVVGMGLDVLRMVRRLR